MKKKEEKEEKLKLIDILTKIKEGKLKPEEAYNLLINTYKPLKNKDLIFARLDINRELRCKAPEVIYGEGKPKKELINIVKVQAEHQDVLITRTSKEVYNTLKKIFKDRCRYNALAGVVVIKTQKRNTSKINDKYALIVSGGTADICVAEEVAETLLFFGASVEKLYDVGVAGIHRLVDNLSLLRGAGVVVVVAGMDGALASVVGGLVDVPVIGVPTSIGYGANFRGLSALLTMLNSCANGVAVVNIDNGFGAGYLSYLILSK